MPVKPNKPILKSTCKACGWTDITLQRSDVMIAPHCCGDCGRVEFERHQQSRFATLVSNPFSLFRWLRHEN